MANKKPSNIPPHVKDISGQRFHRLTAISFSHIKRGHAYWVCICDCGTIRCFKASRLKGDRKPTRSCGCLTIESKTRHGIARTREYKAWHSAIRRCYYPEDIGYSRYGGRGIKMSPEWLHSPTQFLSDMGPCPPSYTLERIDVNGNYEKSNCTWIPRSEQSRNRRNSIMIERHGELHCLKEWSRIEGIPYMTLLNRFRSGRQLF